jgi:ABC-2 type transport system ATP-binding protein
MRPTPWFVRRKVGFGWRPAAWQGWLITALAVGLMVAALAGLRGSPGGRTAAILAIIALYTLVAALTAGDPATASPLRPAVARRSPAVGPPSRPAPLAADTPIEPSQAAVRVEHLTKRFGDRVAFEDVSFTVRAGEVFGFLGPNGAGKTSTVRTLGTLIAPTSGSAVVAGLPLNAANALEIRRRISIMPEMPGLYLRLSIAENLEYFAGLYGLRDPAPRIRRALEAVNLGDRAGDLAGSLSKGLRQRAGLARALLNDPTVLFLDEPTSGLDPVASREVHELIDGLRRQGTTVFLTTHRLEEAERLCDRVAILNTRLRTVGRTDELRRRLFSRTLGVVTEAPLASPERLFLGVTGVEAWRPDTVAGGYVLTVSDPRAVAPGVVRALVAEGADVVSVSETRHSLEDVYLEMIDRHGGAA